MSGGAPLYWLASYPKSGNTWLRVLLANLCSDSDTAVDINDFVVGTMASNRSWLDEVLGFASGDLLPAELAARRREVYGWEALTQPQPQYCKTHDAYTRLPDGSAMLAGDAVAGAVYIVRNPLDVALSAAPHWGCSVDKAIATMAKPDACLLDYDKVALQVPQPLLSWSAHVQSWVDAPELACHVLRYEDMLAAPQASFSAVLRFLQLDARLPRLAHAMACSRFEALAAQEQQAGFRERPAVASRFFRSGRAGGWREQLTPVQIDRIVSAHGAVMQRFGYLDATGSPFI